MVWFLVNKDLFLGFLFKGHSGLVIYDCWTNYLKTWQLERAHMYYLAVSVGQAGWARFPNSGSLTTLPSSCEPGLGFHLKSSTGEGSTSELAQWLLAGFSSSRVVGLSASCSEHCLEATLRSLPCGLLCQGSWFIRASNKDSLLVEWKLLPFVT